MKKQLKEYLSNNYSFGLVAVFFLFQLVARYFFASILLLVDSLLIPYMWLWGKLLGHYVFLYLPAKYIQEARGKAKLNLLKFFMLFLLIDLLVYLTFRIPQVLSFVFIYFVVKDKDLKIWSKRTRLKIGRDYFLYYFFFTLVLTAIRTYYPSIQILSEPAVEDFFNLTGIVALLIFIAKKRG